MNADEFLKLAASLTGTPVKEFTDSDRNCLSPILADDERTIRCSQLNEMLLLVNKDRVSECFFEYFFGEECKVGSVGKGVENFQKAAMLCFGNFIYAFRTLSRAQDKEELRRHLVEHCGSTDETEERYRARTDKLLDIVRVPREDTPLVGYLTVSEIVAEKAHAELLGNAVQALTARGEELTWESLQTRILATAGEHERQPLASLLERHRRRFGNDNPQGFAQELAEAIGQLNAARSTGNGSP